MAITIVHPPTLNKQRVIDYLMLLRQRQDKNDWTTRDIPLEVIDILRALKLVNYGGIITPGGSYLTSSKIY